MTSATPTEPKAVEEVSAAVSIIADSIDAPVTRNGLSIRTKPQGGQDEQVQPGTPGTLVTQMGTTITPRGADQPQDQLEMLLAELGRIEGNQQKLRDAVKHNKAIVVHPRLELLQEEESDADTPKVATPKQLIVSGGLTGFGIAKDLLQIDFSPPEEAPEEFKAFAWDQTPKKNPAPSSALISEGSFGVCDPESMEMRDYLERLELQQQRILELITGKKQELAEKLGAAEDKKPKRVKSRLGKNNRLPATQDKQALSDMLRIPAADDISNGYEHVPKGALANKLPVVPQTASTNVQVMNVLLPDLPELPQQPAPEAPKVRPAVQQPMRKAQVQAADLDRKEQEELLAQFGTPLPGTTPSTMHLAGKSPGSRAEPEESTAQPYYANSSEGPLRRASQSSSRTPVSRAGSSKESQDSAEQGADKPKGILRGFKKLLSKNRA